MAESVDREITLGTGKLLGIFFALVVICAVFFGLGYSLGHSSAPPLPPATDNVPQAVPASGAAKPTAVKPAEQKPADTATPSTTDELTFYKSVEQKDANPELAANAAPAQQPSTPPVEFIKPPAGSYVVQVAAVSKQEDAEALLSALRKKQYPAFLASNPPSDALIHVQVGPFSDVKDAEAMKAKLTSDGYSPILKR